MELGNASSWVSAGVNLIVGIIAAILTFNNATKQRESEEKQRQLQEKLAKEAAKNQKQIADQQEMVTATIAEFQKREDAKAVRLKKQLDTYDKYCDKLTELKRNLKRLPYFPTFVIAIDEDGNIHSTLNEKIEAELNDVVRDMDVQCDLDKGCFEEEIYTLYEERYEILKKYFEKYKNSVRPKYRPDEADSVIHAMDCYVAFTFSFTMCIETINLQIERYKRRIYEDEELVLIHPEPKQPEAVGASQQKSP